MNTEKERVKELLQFSNDKGKITENLTEDYIRGVKDCMDRVDFLWVCEKYGHGDKETWLVMDTYQTAINAIKLLIEE